MDKRTRSRWATTLLVVAVGLGGYALGSSRSLEATEARANPPKAQAGPPKARRVPDPGSQEQNEVIQLRNYTRRLRSMLRTPTMQRFLMLWGSNSEGWFKNRWLGIETIQNPLDVWVTQEILYEVKPDFLVETGTFKGGSAALWATLLEQINPKARIVTVDIENSSAEARKLPLLERKADFLVGSSTDPEIVDRVKELVKGGRVLVILDSLHTREHVLEELRAYSSLVPIGSYVIVQDTGMATPSPPAMGWANLGIDDFLKEDDRFQVDRSRERLILSNNPGGFLKRVR